MESQANILNREWYVKLEKQAATSFINLPIEFQLRGYDYNFIAKSYLNFFQGDNTRGDKLSLAKKFLKFVRNINKNRAKHELGEDFFLCFEYFIESFPDLLAKQDLIHLETLTVMADAMDRSQFIEDIISVEELQRRVKNLETKQSQEEIINVGWEEFNVEYGKLNEDRLLPEIIETEIKDKGNGKNRRITKGNGTGSIFGKRRKFF